MISFQDNVSRSTVRPMLFSVRFSGLVFFFFFSAKHSFSFQLHVIQILPINNGHSIRKFNYLTRNSSSSSSSFESLVVSLTSSLVIFLVLVLYQQNSSTGLLPFLPLVFKSNVFVVFLVQVNVIFHHRRQDFSFLSGMKTIARP